VKLEDIPPSTQWAALKVNRIKFAEVWFKPEGSARSLIVRLPRQSFETPGLQHLLVIDQLLKAINIAPDTVATWHLTTDPVSPLDAYVVDRTQLLPMLPDGIAHLLIHVEVATTLPEQSATSLPASADKAARWEMLESRWNTILGIEATIDSMRLRMESLRGELEAASNKSMSADEKLHAANADVAQWNKAKSRAKFVLPKVKEYIHRATWVLGTHERKMLAELFKHDAQVELEKLDLSDLHNQLENLLKDRQILSAQGTTAYQEGKAGCDDVQRSLRTLQTNAQANAVKKRAATRAKNYF
jgi:hypothetical protein